MKQLRAVSLCLVACTLVLASCNYGLEEIFGRGDQVAGRIADGSTRPVINPGVSAPFRFIISSDLHFGGTIAPSPSRIAAFQTLIESSNPAFAAFCGDIADHGTAADYQGFRAFADGLVKSSAAGGGSLPWFSAIGNHDLYNSGWQFFRSQVGPSYFRIIAGSVSIYGLDSANGTLGQAQIDRLKADFSGDPRAKIILSHYPIRGNDAYIYYRLTNPRERALLLTLFARNRVKAVFVGHWHFPLVTDCYLFKEWIAGSFANGTDDKGHCWVVDVDAAGTVSATEHTLD